MGTLCNNKEYMSFVEILFKYGDYTQFKGMHQNRKMGHHVISARAIDFASFGVPVRF
jgi:hypothetical protein